MILLFFSQFVVATTGCIVNAMDLKIFPKTIVLLKVDHFKGFLNWSNVDELVINSMSDVTTKITNLIIIITNLKIA